MDLTTHSSNRRAYLREGTKAIAKKVQIWKMKPTNLGYLKAQENRIWEPSTE